MLAFVDACVGMMTDDVSGRLAATGSAPAGLAPAGSALQ
jgi:hypothetical protein